MQAGAASGPAFGGPARLRSGTTGSGRFPVLKTPPLGLTSRLVVERMSLAEPGREADELSTTKRGQNCLRALGALASVALLAGCSGDVLGWLPEPASEQAEEIDRLTYLITWITGVTFVLVQAVLVYFLFKYRAKAGQKAKHTHGNHAVEIVWTIVPSLILVLLAVYQAELWLDMKSARPGEMDGEAVPVQIFAKQFEWNFRYPGPDGEYAVADAEGKFSANDDLVTTGALIIPIDRPVLAEERSMDVLHSFFLPNLRFKQDAVPGWPANVWFRSNKLSADRKTVKDRDSNDVQLDYWDIVCAELCGATHSAMSARLYVVSNADYEAWMAGQPTSVKLPEHGKIGPNGSVSYEIWWRWQWQSENLALEKPRWQRKPFGPDDLGPDTPSEDDEEDF